MGSARRLEFVVDGQERALAVGRPEREALVTAEVTARYAPRLAQAGIIHRAWLHLVMRWRIRVEIRREERRVAPGDALYFTREPRVSKVK